MAQSTYRSRDQMISALRQAGWEDELIPWYLAVTKGESSWRHRALNDNPVTGDLSYGDGQINMIGELGVERRAKYGITNEDLFDPVINARVGRNILHEQGPGAWSVTHGGRIPFPNFDHRASYQRPQVFNQGMTIETQGLPGAAYGATNNNDVSVGDLSGAFSATFPGRDLSTYEDDPRFAASKAVVAGIGSIFGASKQQSLPSQPAQLAMSTAGGDLSAGKFSSPTEIYSGEEGHSSYRPDHAGDNSHGHFAYEKPGLAMEAAALLNAHGIQTTELAGVNSVGKHSPNSWHYAKGPKGYGLAFDVPMSQVPVGQEDALYKEMRKILRIA